MPKQMVYLPYISAKNQAQPLELRFIKNRFNRESWSRYLFSSEEALKNHYLSNPKLSKHLKGVIAFELDSPSLMEPTI